MPPRFKEEWIVKVNGESFSLNEKEILVLKEAMKRNQRWVSFKDFILSIPHIECIYLARREIADKLPEGKKEVPNPIPKEKWEEFRKEAYKRIGKKI